MRHITDGPGLLFRIFRAPGMLLVAVLSCALIWPAAAWAQLDDFNFNTGPSTTPKQMLADHLTMLARQALAGNGKPRADQYQRAKVLLDMALDLAPKAADLWRLDAELATRMKNDAAWRTALSHYVDLRPKDDAAQLQLIMAGLQSAQTVDQRLAKVTRLLAPSVAAAFSAPLRSRLATYAATAAHQLGNQKQYATWLAEAATLDPANKQAATMVYQLTESRHGSALQTGAALINLVQAAPLDGSVRLKLAGVLVGEGLYERAARQFRVGQSLTAQHLPDEVYRQWVLSLAASGQADAARQLLNEVEKSQQPQPQGSAQNASQDNAKTTQGSKPNQTPSITPAKTHPLSIQLALPRLALAQANGDENTAAKAFKNIQTQLQATTKKVRKAEKSHTGPEAGSGAGGDLAWIAAVFHQAPKLAQSYLAKAKADDPNAALVRGWLALNAKDTAAATKDLKKIAKDSPLARYGLALLAGPDQASRDRALQDVVKSAPDTLAGMLAAMKLHAGEQPVYPTEVGGSLDQAMNNLPADVWQLGDLDTWVNLRLDVTSPNVTYLQPIEAKITIRNSSRIPLALGDDGSLHANVLLQFAPFVGGTYQGATAPKVVDANRRLTLAPGEAMTIPVRLDRSAFGWAVLRNPFTAVMYNVTAELNPRATAQGITHGALGAMDASRSLQCQILPATATNLTNWMAAVGDGSSVQQLKAIARLVQMKVDTSNPKAVAVLKQVTDAINNAYPTLGDLARAWTVICLPDDAAAAKRFASVLDQAKRSDQPLVRVAYLATKVSDPNSPDLTAAIRMDKPRIHDFAVALQAGLKEAAKEKAKEKPAPKE